MNDTATGAYAAPTACNLSKSEIESLAVAVAETFEYQPGSDLRPIVRAMGGEIEIHDLSGSSSGSIEMWPEGFCISLPLHTGPLRDRFTIAHELGHWVLHYVGVGADENGGPMIATRYGTGRVETEANWFAAAFLMPNEEFRGAWRRHSGDLSVVADIFGVSEAAATVRAEALSLI
ncbi:hypothetical protein CLH39_11855 [Alcaligenes faecalis]|uniref:ImmA/IrrE family metallo-endopeptidase n=1 Tax=Alcaligenes faecalis TaxID=511 RepID=UPI001932ABD5|nr:ImmA/IrrE family metallo-endopeptidase [Alcaligenes faecalis]QRF90883.1 hypothetical protein CLH39_11855 [Alcaligenes faecalis]